ncbi:MAG: radical SAM protein [Candidatus Aminicenantes bacterium]|nr:radical SAM protein [Candidatus Aminicenantes bacterium]
MTQANKKPVLPVYEGFEQGPIRPPSEAYSLLIRVTRNCPWNRCTFCPVYKNTRFSPRPVEHIIKDIDTVHKYVKRLLQIAGDSRQLTQAHITAAAQKIEFGEFDAFQAAVRWAMYGMRSIFIQDANSLVIKPSDMVKIIQHLVEKFPFIERITSYARSDTIARIKEEDLKRIAKAGLNRIHIGLESGSDQVLKQVQKGVTKAIHIEAGLKVKAAGMELSEYVMPGLGGKALWETHALETADALNRINPHFIRMRTLAIPNDSKLYENYRSGAFEKCPELLTAKEIRLFIQELKGIDSMVKSDHILNLFQDVEGKLPWAKEDMLRVIDAFLAMSPDQQCVYQVGRRLGIFMELKDLRNPDKRSCVLRICQQFDVTPENVEGFIEKQMKGFI